MQSVSTEQLIVSLGAVLLTARLFGRLAQIFAQPRVVGEMIAGIVLGPSFLGTFFPSALARILPDSSVLILNALSQTGLLFFMFIVGLEVDVKKILRQPMPVVLTSNFSILVPFGLGLAFARAIYPEMAGEDTHFLPFGLFLGTAMSITAFPVLARILQERGLLASRLGSLAISCAAVDDVTAWFLLAMLTTWTRSTENWVSAEQRLLLLIAFVVFMLIPVRKGIALLQQRYEDAGGEGVLYALILLMLAASWTTQRLGVHPLFGAFMVGLVAPKQEGPTARMVSQIKSVTLAVLLPIFFALTGLRTRIDSLQSGHLWVIALTVLLIAIAGKFLGASLTAKLTGMSWKDSLGLGVLMNTRGLVELVVLNAGLDLGLLSPVLFTMMVLMALVTTLMTAPLLDYLEIREIRLPRDTLTTAVAFEPKGFGSSSVRKS